MLMRSQAAALLIATIALACGTRDTDDSSTVTPPPAMEASTVSLAEAKIRWDAEYRTGFHARETNQAETWRWTTGEAVMSFRNPRADARLNLVVNGRPQRFETPQDVSVWVDDQMVDRFEAASPGIMIRTVPLDRALMGGSESFVVEVHVDRTFVPASVTGSGSQDTRELGIRVLSATIEPSVLVRPPRGLLATSETDETGKSFRWTRRRVLLWGGPDTRVFEVQLRRATGLRQTVRVALNGQVAEELVLEDDRWLRREYEAPLSPDGTARAELLIEPGWPADGDRLSRGVMIGDYLWRE